MRFIRKNGRIIPIKEKYPSNKEKINLAIDATQGVVEGVVARGFWNNKSLVKKVAGFSIGTDIATMALRAKQSKSFGQFLKNEAGGYAVGYAGNAVGFFGTHALIGLAKRYKLAKMAKASAYATSKFGLGKKLIGASNIINTTYKVL